MAHQLDCTLAHAAIAGYPVVAVALWRYWHTAVYRAHMGLSVRNCPREWFLSKCLFISRTALVGCGGLHTFASIRMCLSLRRSLIVPDALGKNDREKMTDPRSNSVVWNFIISQHVDKQGFPCVFVDMGCPDMGQSEAKAAPS